MRPLLLKTSILAFCLLSACTTQTIRDAVGGFAGPKPLTGQDVAAGLKEALAKGIGTGADQASRQDGYLKNPSLRIAFPENIEKVETALRGIGLGSKVDEFVVSMNRAAEDAAQTAKPIFLDAIRSMNIEDAWGILRGPENAASTYLRDTTSDQLLSAFKPRVSDSLGKVNSTRYYNDLVGAYNKIPFAEKADLSLDNYVAQKAIEGLFILVEQEEKNIRENTAARTTELLRRVFAAQD